jgi:hypothetical protein
MDAESTDGKVPVTIITGFLGSGKVRSFPHVVMSGFLLFSRTRLKPRQTNFNLGCEMMEKHLYYPFNFLPN